MLEPDKFSYEALLNSHFFYIPNTSRHYKVPQT